jgi:hypothetical protein
VGEITLFSGGHLKTGYVRQKQNDRRVLTPVVREEGMGELAIAASAGRRDISSSGGAGHKAFGRTLEGLDILAAGEHEAATGVSHEVATNFGTTGLHPLHRVTAPEGDSILFRSSDEGLASVLRGEEVEPSLMLGADLAVAEDCSTRSEIDDAELFEAGDWSWFSGGLRGLFGFGAGACSVPLTGGGVSSGIGFTSPAGAGAISSAW